MSLENHDLTSRVCVHLDVAGSCSTLTKLSSVQVCCGWQTDEMDVCQSCSSSSLNELRFLSGVDSLIPNAHSFMQISHMLQALSNRQARENSLM